MQSSSTIFVYSTRGSTANKDDLERFRKVASLSVECLEIFEFVSVIQSPGKKTINGERELNSGMLSILKS